MARWYGGAHAMDTRNRRPANPASTRMIAGRPRARPFPARSAMKTRHVFSTPDVETARTVMQAARAAGIPEDDISLIARSDIELEAAPEQHKEAGSDFYPAALRGVVGGGAIGLLAGLVAVAIPPVGITVAGVAGLTLAGALTGGWASALVVAAVPDPVR